MNSIFQGRKYRLLASLFLSLGIATGASYGAVPGLAYCSADARVLFRDCNTDGDEARCIKSVNRSIGKAIQAFAGTSGCYVEFKQFDAMFAGYDPADTTLAEAQLFLQQLKQPILDLKGQLAVLADGGPMIETLRQELDKTLAVFESRDYPEHTRDDGIFSKAYWATNFAFSTANIGIGTGNRLASHELYDYLRTACAISVTPSDDCFRRFIDVRSTLRTTQTLSALFTYAGGFRVYIAEAYVDRVLDEWRYYFEEARVQYPWELATELNAVFDNAAPGLLLAPRSQTFWLHPDAGVSYVDGAPDGQQFSPTVILEIYGKNYWDFKPGSKTAQLDGHALGWSLITNYTDIEGVDDFGGGLSIHYDHKYTTSITYHGNDEWALSFNINLSGHLQNLWQETSQEYETRVYNAKAELKDKISELKSIF